MRPEKHLVGANRMVFYGICGILYCIFVNSGWVCLEALSHLEARVYKVKPSLEAGCDTKFFPGGLEISV